ncbi:CDP-diacylglycerol--glycerol-3-phosphate 3-phosphatidyltransferase [Pseudoclavibacter chungangensis]|uniref:CDP-diacylglycerol--glycerol-3-phosphate 3-phosphatidyltransferase n=1 Tax=Pseudoclavibacter chungangensis TaxID=587635 RepID=A0A7J5BMU2_9MICO|nr:CDP-diacylglycerol--glycerol-3-phosphate 3-phosphatidyltransferase [Pseudoclavibacter chungangensis]KAB1653093.1 CDP-diacylglycerol--glycerol-3-phosphate 3-phosphatidyltransferase [Pseudoclavibacter chungangensis]NYJ67019.1 CDP-diacylglycerol--glycerol-3-phosphate 3-phosphatidyltransferase [Pseudoclavibacter chungangensis]
MTGRIIRAGDGPVSNWNVPNVITIVRILLVPVFVWLLLADRDLDGPLRWAAGALFIVAIATDSIDGHLARSRNLVTDLGKLLDPIADKALTGTALVMLSILQELPWWVTIVILVRELGITLWRLALANRRVLPAGRGGKLKTVAQAVAISAALLPLWTLFGDWVHWFNTGLMSIAFVLTVWSGADYLWQAYRPSATKESR